MAHDNLTILKDTELIAGLKQHLADERALQAEFLAYLGEVDRRRLYAELGYSSLFQYCVMALGLAEGPTSRRITTARAARRFPQLYSLIAHGHLHMTAVTLINPFLTKQNAEELLQAVCGKSKREVEQLVARLAPQPDAPDMIRTLPTPQKITLAGECDFIGHTLQSNSDPLPQPPISNEPLNSSLGMGGGGDVQGSQDFTFHVAPPAAHRDQLQSLSEDRIKISFTCSAEFRKKLEQIKSLLWHKYPDGKLEDSVKQGIETQASAGDVSHIAGSIAKRCCLQATVIARAHSCLGNVPFNDSTLVARTNPRLLCHAHNHFRAVQTFGGRRSSVS